jgi:hypothetical protein
VLLLFGLAAIGTQVGYVEDAERIRAVDALGGEGLKVAADAVREGEAVIDGIEILILVVDGRRVRKVNGIDADALGSCATKLSATCSNQRQAMWW